MAGGWAVFLFVSMSVALVARKYEQAAFVEYSTYSPCHYDCAPFDKVYFNFCFQTERQRLIGSVHAWIWQYDPSKMAPLAGQKVSVRFDQKHIWVIRTDGKELRLERAMRSTHFQNPECNNPG